jgi:hypothetical protein
MSNYQAKDWELSERQLSAQTVVYTGNLSTGVGNTDLNASVLVDNTSITATTIALTVSEPVSKCFRVTVRNRVTGANVPLAAAPSISVNNIISVILDASGLTNVVIEFVYSTMDHALPLPGVSYGPAAVNLLSAANYAILAKSTITNTTGSAITGNVAISPAAATLITGFGLSLDISGDFSTSASVLTPSKVFAADYSGTTPALLTQAVSDMEAAYTNAAGRAFPDAINLGAGSLGGLTIQPGLYKFSTGVTIPTNVTLHGGASDTFIFQIAGTLDLAAATSILLTGGVLAKNVVFVVAGAVTLHANSVFNGTILAQTSVAIQTTATVHGRVLAQTAVTLDNVTVTQQL